MREVILFSFPFLHGRSGGTSSSQSQKRAHSAGLISRRKALLAGLSGSLLSLTPPVLARPARKHTPPHSEPLRVLTFSGNICDIQKKILFSAYTRQTHRHILTSGWDGSLTSLQQQEKTNPKHWAAVMMENSSLAIGGSAGLLAPLPEDITAPNYSTSIDYAIAWDSSRFDTPPNWADFWDVARHPGRRSLRRDPRTTLEIALLADGVPPEMVYRTLNTQNGLIRAFQKLDQLRPYIVWWSTPEEAGQILKSGGALMGLAPTGEMLNSTDTNTRRFGICWQQRLQLRYGWGVPHSSATTSAALSFVSWLDEPQQQQAFFNAWPSLPSMREMAVDSSLHHLAPPLVVDDIFWINHLNIIAEHFEQWALRQ
ncbi:spermidine/putrescine ABC transporter substrate-binding protein [Acetobacter pomorum]|uniref:Spermidine/putrescine ABC transporter substrate-binding protein n=1 Tax=Acetobacter pomorum TaxID=65959 RepID=A0A2G4RB59_9PROT|nr:extracellular solute-binding protein [Acetobacter pomorum]PHY93806.1 spermidine/putrescine ABC transporter substrate-binding protein [Acetobacter pomorum]